MKKEKLFRAGASGELDSIVSAGVPPTATRWIFNCVIVRVSNNDIRVPKEIDYFLVFTLPSTVTVFLSIFTPTVVRYLSEKILRTNFATRLVFPTPEIPTMQTCF